MVNKADRVSVKGQVLAVFARHLELSTQVGIGKLDFKSAFTHEVKAWNEDDAFGLALVSAFFCFVDSPFEYYFCLFQVLNNFELILFHLPSS